MGGLRFGEGCEEADIFCRIRRIHQVYFVELQGWSFLVFAGYAKALAFTRLKTVVEPGGAVPLAAALFDEDKISGGDMLVLASGGNLDPELSAPRSSPDQAAALSRFAAASPLKMRNVPRPPDLAA